MKLTSVFLCLKTTMNPMLMKTEAEFSFNTPWGKVAARSASITNKLAYLQRLAHSVDYDLVEEVYEAISNAEPDQTLGLLFKSRPFFDSIKGLKGCQSLTWGNAENPAVFLCHGRMDVCSVFRPLVNLLPDCFYYVSIDLPGNGKSDILPRGVRFTFMDIMPSLYEVKKHFQWDKFAFIGHSLGAHLGKYLNLISPGLLTRIVELDPFPAYQLNTDLASWYHVNYEQFYSESKYHKLNGDFDTAPRYTHQQVVDMLVNTRRLTKEATECVIDRLKVPVGNGLYRLSYDQRWKHIPRFPMSPECLRQLYTSYATPTLAFYASELYDAGLYSHVPFITDEAQWPNNNYKFKIIQGTHDIHVNNPEFVASDIANFLLYNIKAKL